MSHRNSKTGLARLFAATALLLLLCPFMLAAHDTSTPVTHSTPSVEATSGGAAGTDAVIANDLGHIGRKERLVSKFVSQLIEHNHLSNRAVDDEISKRALDRFLKILDPAKAYFLQSDVDEFAKWQTKLDDQLRAGDYTAAFEIFQRFLLRVDQQTALATELVVSVQDFSIDESMAVDPDKLGYASNEAETRERWRKRIKYELLVLRGNQTDRGSEEKMSPSDILQKRYRTFAHRMHQVDTENVIERYLSAITTSFDPHTSYMSQGSFDNFMIQMSLELDGIGATLRGDDDGATVIQHIVDGGAAAHQGGLKPEDKIIAVAQGNEDGTHADPNLGRKYGSDFVDATGMSVDGVVDMIRGKAGTTVRLSVISPDNSGRHTVKIVREKIKLKDQAAQRSIFEEGEKADGTPIRIGVIELPLFYADFGGGGGDGSSTTADVRKLLNDFSRKNVDALVLDLRLNGGGSLEEAIDCTGLFIDSGPVVQVKDSHGRIQVLNDEDRGVAWTKPMIVLTSKFSASASEILAGAIQDYHRGLVVGDSATHGKGTVQNLMNISQMVYNQPNAPNEFGALKLTIQQFYRPNGDSTQKRGVLADIVLPSITDKMDVSESDLEYPVEFDHVQRARFGTYAMTSPESIDSLRNKSLSRRATSQRFRELEEKVARYVEQKNLETVSLNEEKFLARRRELNADQEEEELRGDPMNTNDEIKRDFYLDEVLQIAADYAQLFFAG